AGRIYEQRRVPIAPDDTALTLNTKCYEAAVAAFEELAGDLAAGRAAPRPQVPAARSYFGLRDRPPAACTIAFAEPASSIVNLVRALEFGPARNPLGLAKVRVADGFLAVSRATAHDEKSPGNPGQIVRADDDGVRVTTKTNDV